MATTLGTIVGLPKDTHDKLLPFWLGPIWYTQISTMWSADGGTGVGGQTSGVWDKWARFMRHPVLQSSQEIIQYRSDHRGFHKQSFLQSPSICPQR
jgi:hypothetical protein